MRIVGLFTFKARQRSNIRGGVPAWCKLGWHGNDMITELFIKQCEQAEEIQKLWKPELLDKVITKKTLTNNNYSQNAVGYIKDFEHPYDEYYYKNYGYIWLPTQEQLQEMWWDKDSALHPKDMFRRFSLVLDINEDYFYLFLSPNELWLAVVMHELYNKRWTGKDWITIEATDSPKKKE